MLPGAATLENRVAHRLRLAVEGVPVSSVRLSAHPGRVGVCVQPTRQYTAARTQPGVHQCPGAVAHGVLRDRRALDVVRVSC